MIQWEWEWEWSGSGFGAGKNERLGCRREILLITTMFSFNFFVLDVLDVMINLMSIKIFGYNILIMYILSIRLKLQSQFFWVAYLL